MKKELVLLFGLFLFFPILSQGVKAEVYNVYNCRTIDSSGYWRLMTNISTTDEICFSITASDVILDLNGYSIIHNRPSGVLRTINLVVPYSNVTVKNGFIYAGTDNVSDSSIVWFRPDCYTCENFTIKDLKGYGISGKFLKYGIYISGGYQWGWEGHIHYTTIDNIDFSNVFANYTLYMYITPDSWMNVLYTTIKNSDFRYSRAYDIYIGSGNVKHLISCGLKFNETKVINYGYNVSLSKDPCALVPITVDVFVFDGLAPPYGTSNATNLTNCYTFPNAKVCLDGSCLYSYNYQPANLTCLVSGVTCDPYFYRFNTTEGFHTITIEKAGYQPITDTRYFAGIPNCLCPENCTEFWYWNWIYPYATGRITLRVKDAQTGLAIPTPKGSLYYVNGTIYLIYGQYPYVYGLADGTLIFDKIPINELYYYQISKIGYKTLTSSVFNLTTDIDQTVYLTPALETITLSISPTSGDIFTNFNFSFTTTISPPFYYSFSCVSDKGASWQTMAYYSDLSNVSRNFTGREIVGSGVGDYWTCVAKIQDIESNDVVISIKGIAAVIKPIPELGVYSIIFHPIFIGTMLLISISAYIEYKLRTNGKAFLVAIIILTFVLSIVGFYPAWVGVLIIMAVGFILVYLFREIFWG